MFLIVGLGNPDPKHANNRHNVGFKLLDALNRNFGLSKQKPKFKGLLTNGNILGHKCIVVKPLTFMNNSGSCIREIVDYHRVKIDDIFVFHDDMDIDLGKVKAKNGGSSAGHNGIKSIDDSIGPGFNRIRIGINHPIEKDDVEDHVLTDFTEEEKLIVDQVFKRIFKNMNFLIEKKLDDFSSKSNQQ
ncbi:MAG: aminoacyl-tRNA hydrolase [Candidatus Fonsibacter sp.]|jgi:PTH1 family peptidyl-tRNA hydrolase